jgi:hypothetical protein
MGQWSLQRMPNSCKMLESRTIGRSEESATGGVLLSSAASGAGNMDREHMK